MHEFEVINRYFSKLSSKQKTVLTNEYSSYANALIRAQVKNMDRQNNYVA